MSRTKRDVPLKNLDSKEKELVKKNKFHHPVEVKGDLEEHYSQNAKKEAKKEKHRKQRKESKDMASDVE